jgi:hypothetical protein
MKTIFGKSLSYGTTLSIALGVVVGGVGLSLLQAFRTLTTIA